MRAGLATIGPVHGPGGVPGDAGVVERAGRAFGSRLRLTVAPDPADASSPAGAADDRVDAAWSAVLSELAACDRALSRFRPDGDLALLSTAAADASVRVDGRLRTALALADRARRVTDGRFDAGVGEALDALGERAAFGAEPVRPATPPADPRPSAPVHAPGRGLDLGGIGKGLALRWGLAAARRVLGPGARVLLECGGDLAAAGPRGDGWPVGIEDPAGLPGAEPVAVVTLADGALATSSVRVRRWNDPAGRPVHHLLDPRTGMPARSGLLAVTVHAPDPAWAEVWTKSLFLAGRQAIGPEARARGLAAWWVAADGRLGLTPAAREVTAWADEGRVGG